MDNDVNAVKSLNVFRTDPAIITRLTDTDAWFILTDCPDALKHNLRRGVRRGRDQELMTGHYPYKADLAAIQKAFPDAVVLSKSGDEVGAWNKGKIKMLLCHPASAGHGLNLQRGGALLVWFGLNWSLELTQQFNARLHRQGQTRPVRIVYIVAEDTIDQRVVLALKAKAKTQKELLEYLKKDV